VVAAGLAGAQGWGIWDEDLSPVLQAEGHRPFLCSLDGHTPVLFPYMTTAWSWLSGCEAAGLDLQAGSVRIDVYDNGQGGGVLLTSEGRRGDGPSVVAHPLAER
jgi:hypothetical protein